MHGASRAVGMGILAGCLWAGASAAADVPIDRLCLHMPLDEGAMLAHPANATLRPVGEASFQDAKCGTGLVVDAGGRSLRSLTVSGDRLADPAQGTIAVWVKPLVDFESGRRNLVNLYSSRDRNQKLYFFVIDGKLTFQSCAKGTWPGSTFHFSWVGAPSWSTGTWYHIVVTWGMQRPTIYYVNGERVHVRDITLGFDGQAAPIDSVTVGCNQAGQQQADAVLDELLIFGEVLVGNQIAELMSAGVPALGSPLRPAPEPRGGNTYYLRPGDVVLALGDATTAGGGYLRRAFGDEFAREYPRLASGDDRIRLVNEAAAGATARTTIASVDALLDRHRPQVVLLCLGVNDFYRPAAAFGVSMRSLIRTIKRRRTVDITLLTPPCLYTASYPELEGYAAVVASMVTDLAAIARDEGVTFADCHTPMAARSGEGDFTWGDGVHPGAAGEQMMADALQESWGFGKPAYEERQ